MSNLKIDQGGWVVVADGAKALIIENHGDSKFPNLRTKETFEHHDPKTSEMGTDKPGRSYSSVGSARRAMEQTLDPPADLGPDSDDALRAVLMRGLARESAQRWADAKAFHDALAAWQALRQRGVLPERIVIAEDSTELAPRHPHAVRLQSRLPNVEGAGAVSVRDLVRQALRMRPDRIVVGEVRGGEALGLGLVAEEEGPGAVGFADDGVEALGEDVGSVLGLDVFVVTAEFFVEGGCRRRGFRCRRRSG